MALCPHTQWLDLSGLPNSRECSITYGQRLHSVIGGLSSPDAQFPTVFFFLGKRRKVLALQNIFPNNNITRRKAHGIAGLHLDTATSGSRYPRLFADCNPDAEFWNQIGQWNSCHENIRYGLTPADEVAAAMTSKELVDNIHSRLLLNFVDVVCLFADDLGGAEAVVDRLMRWAQRRRDSHCLPSHKPGVVVVVSGSQARHTLSVMEGTSSFRETFASLTIVDTTAPTSLPVKRILTHEANKVRECRSASRVLYTATHMKVFFVEALKDFAATPQGGFDFIAATRRGRRGPHKLTPHIQQFLSLATREGIDEPFLSSFVASALLMDGYPPGMHCMQWMFSGEFRR
jgi:hypothetical protein